MNITGAIQVVVPRLRPLTSGQQELLRWLAIVTMIVDHIGVTLLTPEAALPLRAVGRIAWPLFAFLMAYNIVNRGVNPLRYLRPLAVGCVVSAIPYYLAFESLQVNIFGTLLLGAAVIALIREPPEGLGARLLRALALAGVLLAGTQVEYGLPGVLLAPAFWWALREPRPLPYLILVGVDIAQNIPWIVSPFALLALPLPFLITRVPANVPRSGRFPWLFYPIHLLVLALLDRFI